MLTIEKLICADAKHHKGCNWIKTPIEYTDDKYPMIRQSLQNKVTKSKIAHRVIHNIRGVILTIKVSHDGNPYIKENE